MKYERHLRAIRRKIFDYPPEKVDKASRVLEKIKVRHLKQIEPERAAYRMERDEAMLRLWA